MRWNGMCDVTDQSLAGRIAIVTGASRGVGRAIAVKLASAGAYVAVNYRQSSSEAELTLRRIQEAGGTGALYPADVRDAGQIAALVDTVYRQHGRIDILVNNAGIARDHYFLLMPAESWHTVIDTDLNGVFTCTRAVVRRMCSAKRGVIITIGSGSGLSPRPGQVNYSCAKSALIGYSRSLACELAPYGIRVNVVAPGFTATAMSEALTATIVDESLRMIPLGRWAQPDEVSAAVAFAVSDDAAFLTGQTLVIDGGRTALEQEYGY
jgi:3-oxoacyl-[acyl-carrier protein] reductase